MTHQTETPALSGLADRFGLSPADVEAAIESDPELAAYAADAGSYFYSFTPRPDRPENFDQQTGFVESRDTIAFMIAGNGSGKTEAAAYKAAQFLCARQPPPRRDTPFWVVTNTMHMAGEVLWKEKLLGNGHLPRGEVAWDRITWDDKKANHPKIVPLLPWPEDRGGDPDRNWQIEFKSFEMGRASLQAASIGGFWYSEQFPVDLFTETIVRCRDYLYPGGQFAEFTPLEPDLCIWIEKLLDEHPKGWGFYRGNTEANRANLAEGAIEAFLVTVPDELVETRLRGALATFEGAIYPSFSTAVHVVEDKLLSRIPHGCWHAMATDWGSSVEHPHVTLWGCMDAVGDWWIYDELWSCDQTKTTFERAQEVVARCAAWGWPIARGKVHGLEMLRLAGEDPHFGFNFADPSRPGEINEFAMYGVPSMPAVNRVYDGINLVRGLLKIQPNTGKPKLFIAKRCKHLIEEMRKYRWRKSKKPTEGNFLNPAVAAPQPLKREDDAPDALRYLIASYNRGLGGASDEPGRKPTDTPQRRSVQLAATRATAVASRGAAAIFHPTR
jgi:phage terminase large subunit-like protein